MNWLLVDWLLAAHPRNSLSEDVAVALEEQAMLFPFE
jgi:hypothetical protein